MEAFRKQIRIAAARFRLERLARASRPIAWTLATALLFLLLLSLATDTAAFAIQIALALLLLGLAWALVVYRLRVDRHRLLIRMDAQAKLPDAILSTGDWESAATDPWREGQRVQTVRLLEMVNWRQVWPVRWPRLLWFPLACSVLLAAVVGIIQMHWIERNHLAQLASQQENAPVPTEQLKPLEQVFQDWDEAQKLAPSPEMEELLKQIKPMRDQMAAGRMTEKQLFLKVSEVQARVQAAKDKLEAGSLEPMAQSLADAVKDLDGMSGLSAALQRKDFAAARDQAAQAADKYNTGAAKMPEGASAQASAAKLGEASQKASNDAQASSALSQMQNAVGKKDGAGMSQGLGGLKSSLAKQSQRQSQCHGLGLQLAQLSQCKSGMCQGSGIKMGLPMLSLVKSMEPGKGAGTSTDPNRVGAPTQLDASHQEMKITGTAGEGTSETQTESTMDPHFEQTAGSVNASQFDAYKKLSDQATEDENLPVADRQMIKRYFEDIRPQAGP